MNPRAAINDLHPFQGCPFSLLGTSPRLNTILIYEACCFSGEGGIRTHVPLRTNGFQDRLVMTSSIPLRMFAANRFSSAANVILAKIICSVNNFF